MTGSKSSTSAPQLTVKCHEPDLFGRPGAVFLTTVSTCRTALIVGVVRPLDLGELGEEYGAVIPLPWQAAMNDGIGRVAIPVPQVAGAGKTLSHRIVPVGITASVQHVEVPIIAFMVEGRGCDGM